MICSSSTPAQDAPTSPAPPPAAMDSAPPAPGDGSQQPPAPTMGPDAPAAEPAAPEDVAPPAEPMNVETIHEVVDPYGTWVEVDGLGQCWRPSVEIVGADFTPYCEGRWAYGDYGWSWCSNYSWGWVPFHYGRWNHSAGFGWCWYPDTCWGPSWVSWRACDGYFGWAPLGPCWGGGFVGVALPGDFLFCSRAHFCQPFVGRFCAPRSWSPSLCARSAVIAPSVGVSVGVGVGGTFAQGLRVAGPQRVHVAQAIGRPVPRAVPTPALSRAAGFRMAPRSAATEPQFARSRQATGVPRGTAAPQPQVMAPRASAPRTFAAAPPQRTAPPRTFAAPPQTTAPPRTFAAPRTVTVPQPRTFAAPRSFTAPPARTFSAPSHNFSAPPARSFSAPRARSFSAPPARNFSAPSHSFSAPSHSFSAPSHSFSAPSRSFSAPSHSSGFHGGGGGGRHR